MLNILAPILLALQPSPTFVKVHVHNYTQVQKVGDRDVLFGVKENIKEILIEKGYTPIDSGDGFDVHVSIDSIYSPQQLINIVGLQWLRKDHIVETTICIGPGCFNGKGERKTYIFAMFLDVENGEVPLNRKAFSKALQEAFLKTSKQF